MKNTQVIHSDLLYMIPSPCTPDIVPEIWIPNFVDHRAFKSDIFLTVSGRRINFRLVCQSKHIGGVPLEPTASLRAIRGQHVSRVPRIHSDEFAMAAK